MNDMQEARDRLADALWWMRGYAAAGDRDSVASDLADKLASVHAYLRKVEDGEVRRLGEETAVVMTFAEFERLVDAVRVPQPQEIKAAAETIEKVLAAYRHEERAATNPDLPF